MTIEQHSQGATYAEYAGLQSETCDDVPIFITINHDENRKIFELFVRIDSKEHFEIVNLITRLVSMALRAGVNPKIIAKDLKSVYSMTTQHIIPGTTVMCPSIIARIGLTLERHIKDLKEGIIP